MNPDTPLLAAVSEGGVNLWYKLSAGTREWIIILAAVGSVTVLVLFWALFFRKRHHTRSSRYAHDWAHPSGSEQSEHENTAPKKRRKWRRRRREHRPMNPTLAETGGLPPARPDSPHGPSV